MIAERSTVTITGNMGGNSYRAGVDDEDMAHLINLFTDLYSDPERAVIREYSTNAYDAQVEAGYTGPIEVTLPSALTPQFTVRDYGTGLDESDIQRVYSRYGKSTKRATNDQNGMLGLGCKSALTYVEQFTVESIKDGVRTVCAISRGDDGVPVFATVATLPDDGPNGTEVVVPVRRSNRIAAKAAQFYSYWAPNTVLVNGKAPHPAEGLHLADDIMLVERDRQYEDPVHRVLMGNVTYPIDSAHLTLDLPRAYELLIKVDIGAVSFVPSREALMYTAGTKAALADIPERVKAAVHAAIQAEVDAAPTRRAAVEIMIARSGLLRNNAALTYKGDTIPKLLPGQYKTAWRNSARAAVVTEHRHGLSIETAQKALFVTGFDVATFTATHKRKIIKYLDTNAPHLEYAVLSEPCHVLDPAADKWIDPAQFAKWEDIRQIVLPKTAPTWSNGRPTGSYDAYVGGKFQHTQADEIDDNEKIIHLRAINRRSGRIVISFLMSEYPDATIVCVPENRYKKFKRSFPAAESHYSALDAAYLAWNTSLTVTEQTTLAIHDASDTFLLHKLDPARVKDPEVRAAIRLRTSTDVTRLVSARQRFGSVMSHITAQAKTANWINPLTKYPLVAAIDRWNYADYEDAIYEYMNALHKNGGKL